MFNAAAKSFPRPGFAPLGASVCLALTTLGRVSSCNAAADLPLPPSAQVTRRLIEHSQALAATNGGPKYIYPKRTLIERLDSSGQVASSEERLYEVTLVGGVPLNRLLKITGREMTPDELEEEQQREERFQQRVSSMDPKKLVARREGLVTAELLNHYQFTVSRRIQLYGRATLVVDFKPKDNPAPAKGIRDRVLNRIAGTLWVDEEDGELAKVSARLTETIYMGWFGWMG